MKDYLERTPDWMNLLYDQVIGEAHNELQEQSEAYQYYQKLSRKIQDKNKFYSLIVEHATMKKGETLTQKQMQDLSDLFESEYRMQYMILQKVYWKAWRDCIRSLKMAGEITVEVEHYERIPFVSGK